MHRFSLSEWRKCIIPRRSQSKRCRSSSYGSELNRIRCAISNVSSTSMGLWLSFLFLYMAGLKTVTNGSLSATKYFLEQFRCQNSLCRSCDVNNETF